MPARDRWHQRDQRLRRQTGHIQKLQQRLQLGHPAVGRTDAERTALRRQERDNVGRGEVLDPAVLGHTLPQDRAGQLHVTHDRGLGQTSIRNKPPTVTLLPAPRPATPVRVTRQAPLRISDSPAADPNLARPARIAFRLAELRDHAPIHPAGRNVPAVHPSAQIACNCTSLVMATALSRGHPPAAPGRPRRRGSPSVHRPQSPKWTIRINRAGGRRRVSAGERLSTGEAPGRGPVNRLAGHPGAWCLPRLRSRT